jgi:hypothetical protein
MEGTGSHMDILLPKHILETIDHFSGRTWLVSKVLKWFDEQSDPLLILVGKPGTGKSMIAAWFAGFGPEPLEQADRANLERLRKLVVGAHFAQVDSDQNAPKVMADQLARQITSRVKGFDKAMEAVLGQRVQIDVDQTGNTIEAGATVTGVYIKHLDLGRLLGPGGVEQALLHPLRWIYDHGYNEQILLVIDSLDEANLYKNNYRITDAVLEIARLNLPVRVLATARDEEDSLARFRAYPKIDLILDAPGTVDDIRDYVGTRLQGIQNVDIAALGKRIADNANGNFLFAHLVVDDLIERLKQEEVISVDHLPGTLSQHYHNYMQRLGSPSQWQKQYARLLGLLAVAQDPGLERPLIAGMIRRKPDSTLTLLRTVKPFLEGNLDNGPFRSFHKSFTEFLLEDDANTDYRISSATPHANIVYYYWPRKKPEPPTRNWDGYARRYMITHLAGAGRSLDDQERHLMAQRLVETVSDPVLADLSSVDVQDLADTARELAAAVEVACGDDLLEGLPLVMRAVRAHQAFYRAVLKPSHIFDHAEKGEVEYAVEKLALFETKPRWQKAARLEIAWLAAQSKPAQAAVIRDQVPPTPPFPAPLYQLLMRVNHSLGAPEPPLLSLPEPPDESVVDEILAGILGNKIDMNLVQSYRLGANLVLDSGLSEELNAQGDQGPSYQALEHAPILVSFAGSNKQRGNEVFQQYLRIQGANLYVYYRNITLWIIIEAVLRHPDDNWARGALRQILELALAGERALFEEYTSIMLLGLRAASRQPQAAKALAELEKRTRDEIDKAGLLDSSRRHGDSYGEHKHRLCALAAGYLAIPNMETQTRQLLKLALEIPIGSAGFMYKAWLTLYETLLMCEWPNPMDLSHCMDQALLSAHKIQDPIFCILATARMRTMRDLWLARIASPSNIQAVVEQFAREPLSATFAPVHVVADNYSHRYEPGGNLMRLPDPLVLANNLWDISEQLGLSLEGLIETNQELSLRRDTPIAAGGCVYLFDPDFVPLVAQRLSGDVVRSGLEPREKRRLLQMMMPHTLQNRTSLDILLARLLFVSETEDFESLDIPAPGEVLSGGIFWES